jgi:hypothetical protein
LILALPFVLYQAYAFLMPALHAHERRHVRGLVMSIPFLFVAYGAPCSRCRPGSWRSRARGSSRRGGCGRTAATRCSRAVLSPRAATCPHRHDPRTELRN